jgi:AraC-like DNA-binding protein
MLPFVHLLRHRSITPFVRFTHYCSSTINAAPRYIFDHELLLVYKGEGEIESFGKKASYHSGAVIMVPPGVVHSFREFKSDEAHIAIHFDWEKGPRGGDELWHFVDVDKHHDEKLTQGSVWLQDIMLLHSGSKVLFDLAEELLQSFETKEPFRHLRLQTCFTRLILQLMEDIQGEELTWECIGPARRGSILKERADVLDIIARLEQLEHDEAIRVEQFEEICKSSHFSASHFRRIFKEQIGVAPQAFFTHLRIKKASRLLLEGAYSVREVAYRCGYDDPNYFSKIFRHYEGMSPQEYRANMGNLS